MTKLYTNIYLVEAENRMVKIGSSFTPIYRAQTICSHSPIPCRLVATWPGTQSEEFALHRRFERYRSHSEWFFLCGDLAVFVSENAGRGLEEPIVSWESLRFEAEAGRKAIASAKRSLAMKKAWQRAKENPSWCGLGGKKLARKSEGVTQ